MGLFCVNAHFRTEDDQALVAALDRRGVDRYHLAPAKNGWTSLYEARASDQDDQRIRNLVGGLSADLEVAAISFLVHDSDIACYWLYDDGRLLDSYNSCPDYFDDDAVDDDAAPSPAGGQPQVLLPYCQDGVQPDELAAILTQESLFAENIVEQLAEAMGIDVQRALTDYRDVNGGNGSGGPDGLDGDGDDFGGGPDAFPPETGLEAALAKVLGTDSRAANANPQAKALVSAAAQGNIEEMDQLLASGAQVDAEAPAPLPGGQPMAGLGQLFPSGAPEIVMTPLLAAVANSQHETARRLLAAGADPNHTHALFGTPVHAAAGAGNVELLQDLIDGGGDVSARNAQGQTPLDVVTAGRAMSASLAQAQSLLSSLGTKIPGVTDKLPVERLMSEVTLPTQGWDACEQLLKAQANQ
jgi:hypothetical protein